MIGKYPHTKALREQRRERAEKVQAANKRASKEQLAHLDKMGFQAAKERAKIAKKLQKEAEAAPKKGKA